MALYVDKYRPLSLEKLDYHEHLTRQLKRLAARDDMPHLLFYGPSGAGKKTRITALLREIYGSGVEKLKAEHRSFKMASGTSLELTTFASSHHIEMNPGDAGIYDRAVVQDIIKEIAQSGTLDARAFKIVLLTEVDRLTREAQHALRRTMEKYTQTCRIILCCNSTTKVIEPLRSRCLGVRVPAPEYTEIVRVLGLVAKKEGMQLPTEFAMKVAVQSERNLRRALLMLEATKIKAYPFQLTQTIETPDWELFLHNVARDILNEQSPRCLLAVRGKLYDLLGDCIPPELILKRLTVELLAKLDSQLRPEVAHWAAFYEHRIQIGSKVILHLEAFVAKFMSLYKRFLIETFGF